MKTMHIGIAMTRCGMNTNTSITLATRTSTMPTSIPMTKRTGCEQMVPTGTRIRIGTNLLPMPIRMSAMGTTVTSTKGVV